MAETAGQIVKFQSDQEALEFLHYQGIHVNKGVITCDTEKTYSLDEARAICYLTEEWDYTFVTR